MQSRYQTANNSARFFDSDIPTLTLFTRSNMAGFTTGSTVIDPQGFTQTILEITPLPGSITRVLMAEL